MKLIHKLLDYSKPWTLPDVYLFTGNPIIKKDGAIVMGRGAAKQVRDTYPGIDQSFGMIIQRKPQTNLAWISLPNDMHLGWFKVKNHWAEQANELLIKDSTEILDRIANKHRDKTFHMNFPGIGNGKLGIDRVMPIIELLPDNVWIYK